MIAWHERCGAARMIDLFTKFARWVSVRLAHPIAFTAAFLLIVGWALSGPLFNYSEQWQLIINTGTTIVTFLMVFVIQNTQNRDSRAMHLKLDELLRALHGARNDLIDLEDVTEAELQRYCREFEGLHKKYETALKRRTAKKSRPATP